MRLRQSIAIIVIALTVTAVSNAQARRKGSAKTKPKPTPTITQPSAPAQSPKELAEAAAASRAKLMEASQNYRESLERLLELQKQDEVRAADLLKRRQELLDLGVIAKREVEEGEVALKETQKKIEETNSRLNEVDQLVAEVTAAEELAKHPPETEKESSDVRRSRLLLVRYTGRSVWSLASDYAKVDAYFRQTFGRALPVSAFGQTETHNRMGFDHTNSLDVAVHPDSGEGQALQAYLRAAGISFLAIRGAIAGSATGAHIHIGAPSRRLSL